MTAPSRFRVVLRAAVATIIVALPAGAVAPQDQYEYFTAPDNSIKDRFTRLRWQRGASAAPVAYEFATCSGGFRLPTLKELLTIVDETPHPEYEGIQIVQKAIDQAAFPDTPVNARYWTSSPAPGERIWTVDFKDGSTIPDDADANRYVRCVRFEP
jgi:uncharacterized protein DUF1566